MAFLISAHCEASYLCPTQAILLAAVPMTTAITIITPIQIASWRIIRLSASSSALSALELSSDISLPTALLECSGGPLELDRKTSRTEYVITKVG